MSIFKTFFKSTIIYGIGAILPRIINFLLVPIHTDTLSANVYAQNTNFYIWIAFFAVLLTFGMETAFFRFYSKEKDKDRIIATSFISIAVTTLLFLVGTTIFFPYLLQGLDFYANPLQLKILIAILAIDTLCVIPFAYLRVTERPVNYTAVKLINVGIIFIVNILFLVWIPDWIENQKSIPAFLESFYKTTDKVNFIFIANLLGSIVSFGLLLPYLLKFTWKFDFRIFKKMWYYGWPVAVAGIAYVINENLDKWLIKQYIGDSAMGIYSACYKLGIFMNLYITAFRLGAEPFFFNHAKDKNAPKTYALILNYFVIVGAFFFLGVVGYVDILKILFIKNKEYWEAISVVPIILLANLLSGIYHNLSVWYKVSDKTPFAMLFSITGAVVTIIANVLLIPKIGYIASAWATLLAYGTMMILSFWTGRRYYPIPYDLKKIGSYLIFSVLLSYFSFIYFRENYWFSTLSILLFGGLIYWNERTEIRKILAKK